MNEYETNYKLMRARKNIMVYTCPYLYINSSTYYDNTVVLKDEMVLFIREVPNVWYFGQKITQLLYKNQIYYVAISDICLNNIGPDWEHVLV